MNKTILIMMIMAVGMQANACDFFGSSCNNSDPLGLGRVLEQQEASRQEFRRQQEESRRREYMENMDINRHYDTNHFTNYHIEQYNNRNSRY